MAITTDRGALTITFPELGRDARLHVTFQRALRTPDPVGRPGAVGGHGALRLAQGSPDGDAHATIPMWQSEATWLDFSSPHLHPFLVMIGVDGVNVVSGSAFTGVPDFDADDYLRAIDAEKRNFAAQTGQTLSAEQARQIGLTQVVQSRLFTAAALEDEARRIGVSVGDQVLASELRDQPAFKGPTGKFDPARYAEVLRSQGLTASDFEHDVRMDQARLILQSAVTDGVAAPEVMSQRTAGWMLESRDIAWQELTDADLPAPIAAPDEATLRAWHEANGARFTAPEKRQITYAWLTPEMLVDSVQLDDQALRDIYQQNITQ